MSVTKILDERNDTFICDLLEGVDCNEENKRIMREGSLDAFIHIFLNGKKDFFNFPSINRVVMRLIDGIEIEPIEDSVMVRVTLTNVSNMDIRKKMENFGFSSLSDLLTEMGCTRTWEFHQEQMKKRSEGKDDDEDEKSSKKDDEDEKSSKEDDEDEKVHLLRLDGNGNYHGESQHTNKERHLLNWDEIRNGGMSQHWGDSDDDSEDNEAKMD